jgi:hypothetical protein
MLPFIEVVHDEQAVVSNQLPALEKIRSVPESSFLTQGLAITNAEKDGSDQP